MTTYVTSTIRARPRQGADRVAVAALAAPSAPAENPTSRARAVWSAQSHPCPETIARNAAAPSTPASWVTTAVPAARRVPIRYSAKPQSSTKLPRVGTYCCGVWANRTPDAGVHQRPSENAGSP